MCGIVGYVGKRQAYPILIKGLHRLEYRGYDSAGLALVNREGVLNVFKSKGKVADLEHFVESKDLDGTIGIAHTRWATHGEPNDINAHPHYSDSGNIALIHNGIIENYRVLKEALIENGYTFKSDTDTEVLVNLIEYIRTSNNCTLLEAVQQALKQVIGAYAIAVVEKGNQDQIIAARRSSPMVIGIGDKEFFLASDAASIVEYTDKIVYVNDGEVVVMDRNHPLKIVTLDNQESKIDIKKLQLSISQLEKGGYPHFMLKEIFEQPQVIVDGLSGRLNAARDTVLLPELDALPVPRRLHIVACGTSYHSGLWARHLIEPWAKVPVQLEIASEFRYRESLPLDKDDMVLVISQSGETADTLAALRIAREHGVPVLGLCNVVGSSIARESSAVIYTQAGPEISVASTKAMCSQMLMLALVALYWGGRQGIMDAAARARQIALLESLPSQLDAALPAMHEKARQLARAYAQARNFFYLGRGHCYPLALEGALKLKELSYIHAEGYAAGEMKHGPIALIDLAFPTFALALDDALFPKVKSNIVEVQARQGKVIALTNPGMDLAVDDVWEIPALPAPLAGFMALPAMQLFSYEMADYLGKDVDQPRNLAKSVTVE